MSRTTQISLCFVTGVILGIWFLKGSKKIAGENTQVSAPNVDRSRKKPDKKSPPVKDHHPPVETPDDLSDCEKKYLPIWGTPQGVIDVACDDIAIKKERDRRLKKGLELGGGLRIPIDPGSGCVPQQGEERLSMLKRCLPDLDSTQIVICNNSSSGKKVILWDSRRGIFSPPNPGDIGDLLVTTTVSVAQVSLGVHPQGVSVNPFNNLAYIANQLSDNITVIDHLGQAVQTIDLSPSLLPGVISPVDVAVNNNALSAGYGKTFIVGSVSNTVEVIETNFTVSNSIGVGSRPVAAAFNPVNNALYVVNLADNAVSVIDTTSEVVTTTLGVGNTPRGVAIDSTTGNIFVANSKDGSISVFSPSNTLITTIPAVGNNPTGITFNPTTSMVYVSDPVLNQVTAVNATTYTIEATIGVGNNPNPILFNQLNNLTFIGNRDDETFSVLDSTDQLVDTLSLGPVNNGLSLDPTNKVIYSTNAQGNSVSLIGYNSSSSEVTVSGDYQKSLQELTYNPAVVRHAKIIFSQGTPPPKAITITNRSVRGKADSHSLSLNNYRHPQHFSQVYDIKDVDGFIINGLNTWELVLSPNQCMTLLVHYQQIFGYHLLPQEPIPRHTPGVFSGGQINLDDQPQQKNH